MNLTAHRREGARTAAEAGSLRLDGGCWPFLMLRLNYHVKTAILTRHLVRSSKSRSSVRFRPPAGALRRPRAGRRVPLGHYACRPGRPAWTIMNREATFARALPLGPSASGGHQPRKLLVQARPVGSCQRSRLCSHTGLTVYPRPRSWDRLPGAGLVIKLARDRDEADLGCRRSGVS